MSNSVTPGPSKGGHNDPNEAGERPAPPSGGGGDEKAAVYTDRLAAALAVNTETRKFWPPLTAGDVTLYVFAGTERQAKDAANEHLWQQPLKPLTVTQKQQFVNDVLRETAGELAAGKDEA
jgi:hypothetical protein